MENWNSPENGISNTTENSNVEQAQITQTTEDYKNLQAAYTKSRQNEISLATKTAEVNPESILSFDVETQNKVIEKIYWYKNLDELTMTLWKEFYNKKNSPIWEVDEWLNKMTQLENELKILKYRGEQESLENSIKEFKIANPSAFEDESADSLLRDNLKLINGDWLTLGDRVDKAAKLAFWNIANNPSRDIYNRLWTQWKMWAKSSATNQDAAKETYKNELSSFLKDRWFMK